MFINHGSQLTFHPLDCEFIHPILTFPHTRCVPGAVSIYSKFIMKCSLFSCVTFASESNKRFPSSFHVVTISEPRNGVIRLSGALWPFFSRFYFPLSCVISGSICALQGGMRNNCELSRNCLDIVCVSISTTVTLLKFSRYEMKCRYYNVIYRIAERSTWKYLQYPVFFFTVHDTNKEHYLFSYPYDNFWQ